MTEPNNSNDNANLLVSPALYVLDLDRNYKSDIEDRLEIRSGLTRVSSRTRREISLSVSLQSRSCQPFSPSSGNELPLPGAHAISRRTMPVRFYSTACMPLYFRQYLNRFHFRRNLTYLTVTTKIKIDENKNRRKMKLHFSPQISSIFRKLLKKLLTDI